MEYLSLKQVTQAHLKEIEEAVNRVIESGWYLRGEATQTFEEQYQYCFLSAGCWANRRVFFYWKTAIVNSIKYG